MLGFSASFTDVSWPAAMARVSMDRRLRRVKHELFHFLHNPLNLPQGIFEAAARVSPVRTGAS